MIEVINHCRKIIANIDAVMSVDGYMYFARPSGTPVRTHTTERISKTRNGQSGSRRNFGRKPRRS